MDPDPEEHIIEINGIMVEDDVYYEAEVLMVANFPYIAHVDYFRDSDMVECKVTVELEHRVHVSIKQQLGYYKQSVGGYDYE